MEFITHFLHQGFSFVVPLIVLLGVLIFVHELGHFSVAKYFGVRVEVFSLGFGRKILKKKVGDTVYCLSAIPFGGYVKMFGDDPTASVSEEEKKFSFNHKPVLPRIAIVLAGPLMNAFFAAVLFILIAAIGEETIGTKLGHISPASAAYQAGFRNDDLIEKVNGQSVRKWDEVKKAIEDQGESAISFEVKRNGETIKISATPTLVQNKNILSSKALVGDIEGLTYLKIGSGIGVTSPTSLAAKSGLKSGDIIKSINGKEVDAWDQVTSQLVSESQLQVERATKTLQISLPEFKAFRDLGIESSELYLSGVVPKSGADIAGVQIGDKILSIGGKKISRWEDVVKTVQATSTDKSPIAVELQRDGKIVNLEITPQLVTQTDATGHEKQAWALGVVTGLVLTSPSTFIAKESTLGGMFTKGIADTIKWTDMTVMSFVKLIQRKVSAKSIGGPLMIGKLASDTWKIGVSAFLKIMAIISINLFILNLLPVPVLDGGHLLFFTIELIKGSPLSFKVQGIMQNVGMALLLALMVFSMFNDVVRLFTS